MKTPYDLAFDQFGDSRQFTWEQLAEGIAKMPAEERAKPVCVLLTDPNCEGGVALCSMATPASGTFEAGRGDFFEGYFINASFENHRKKD